jgi:hypothetical protein
MDTMLARESDENQTFDLFARFVVRRMRCARRMVFEFAAMLSADARVGLRIKNKWRLIYNEGAKNLSGA